MKRITFEGHFCDICQCIGEPGNTSECPGGYCDQRRTWERLKEYEDKIERGELAEVVRCKDCKHYHARGNKGNSAIWDCKKKLCCRSANMTVKPDDFCSFGERRTDV